MVALLVRLRKLVALPRGERGLLVLAAVCLPLTALGLRVAAFERVLAALGRLAGRRPLEAEEADVARRAQRTEQLVCWAARHGLHRGNCLSQSLTLWWLLRRQGIASDLRLGVYKDAGRLEAHAWIECGGRVLNDRGGIRQRVVAFEGALPHDALQGR